MHTEGSYKLKLMNIPAGLFGRVTLYSSSITSRDRINVHYLNASACFQWLYSVEVDTAEFLHLSQGQWEHACTAN